MKDIKNHWKKWLYWFLLGVAIIIVYKALDNFTDIMGVIEKLFSIIAPFLIGIFIAYLLYIPCKKIEETYTKSRIKFIRNRARKFSIITVYLLIIVLIIV